ncbi:hypothetical protein GCM10022415_16600 [Knoellia locipacati]|uniref:DUF4333 domain-containing protein n=1 Tax=Knoellia locipacati TaxID=882824 RepID=A0A512T061_9MICO|nr:hypothetical protein [Knoellia locipacati]GEQ13608.1 hypothetical protein KLO01_16550 [Knoellia locipacati]
MSVPPPYALAAPPSAAPTNRPSWVAWTALALSAAAFVVATGVGIVYAANTLSDGSADGSGEGLFYDAGMPVWGTVELAPSGAATERILTDSLEDALRTGIEDFDGSAEDISDVYCEALTAPRTNSVATCVASVQDVETTVVLVFLDDEGGYLATVY